MDSASDEGLEPGFEDECGGGEEDAEGGCEGDDEDALELVEDVCGHCVLGFLGWLGSAIGMGCSRRMRGML